MYLVRQCELARARLIISWDINKATSMKIGGLLKSKKAFFVGFNMNVLERIKTNKNY